MDVQAVDMIDTNAGKLDRLSAYMADVLAAPALVAKLFQTNVAIGPTTLLSSLSEADYADYAPIAVAALNGPYLDSDGNAYATTNLLDFVCAGGGNTNTIYSVGLCVGNGGTQATGTIAQTLGVLNTPVVVLGGDGYSAPPPVTITGATGSGGRAHAVLTGDAVTSIVIDDGGTGYTLPVVTIEPPVDLIGGANFSNPLPMALSTDAIPTVLQLQQTS